MTPNKFQHDSSSGMDPHERIGFKVYHYTINTNVIINYSYPQSILNINPSSVHFETSAQWLDTVYLDPGQ